MNSYDNKSNEELVTLAQGGDECAYLRLFRNLRPIILKETRIYSGKMVTFDQEDLIQEAEILVWEIIRSGHFKSGYFAKYFTSALRFKMRNIFRDYSIKNPVMIANFIDERGEGFNQCILVESSYAKSYREKHRKHCRESYARKKQRELEAKRAAGIPDPEPKPVLSEEEKRARRNARSLAYYHAHKDELNAKRKAKREMSRVTQ